jgi:hypothetical protein
MIPVTKPPPITTTLFQVYGTDLTFEWLAEPLGVVLNTDDASVALIEGGVIQAVAESARSAPRVTNFDAVLEEGCVMVFTEAAHFGVGDTP